MAAASLLFPPSYSHSLSVFTTIKPFSFSILPTSKPTYFSLVPSSSKPSSTSSSPITPKKKSHASSIHYSIPTTNPSSFDPDANEWDPSQHEALLKGGEQVTSVLEEMITLLEDMELDAASEAAAVELAAQGVIGKRVDEMESGFMMALDYMIQIADKDSDDQRKSLLEVMKRTVLDHLTKKCPPHVQVIGLLCRTPQKQSRHELLRRVAAGGGVFKSENGLKVQLPAANLNDIANQADDLLETMESRPAVPDRKLLARLVLIREEARNMMGGGLLDERNVRGLSTLPEAEVNYLSKLVSLRPGKTVKEMISNVMHGKDEGADTSGSGDESSDNTRQRLGGIAGRGSVTGRKPRPVRPGMFLETVSKVLSGIYAGSESGITAQHLEWGMKGLQIPAFGNWDDCDDMPITQHFESAVQAGLIKSHLSGEEEDLFKVPVASMKPTYQRKLKKGEINKQGNRVHDLTTKSPRKQHKAVDEDLYKIPPELLYQKPKRNRMRRNFWSGCLGSNCVACA